MILLVFVCIDIKSFYPVALMVAYTGGVHLCELCDFSVSVQTNKLLEKDVLTCSQVTLSMWKAKYLSDIEEESGLSREDEAMGLPPHQCNMYIIHPCALAIWLMHMGCPCAFAIVVNAHGATHVHLPLAVWNYHFTIDFVFVVIFVIVFMMFSTLN